jgi:hypothetical protein
MLRPSPKRPLGSLALLRRSAGCCRADARAGRQWTIFLVSGRFAASIDVARAGHVPSWLMFRRQVIERVLSKGDRLRYGLISAHAWTHGISRLDAIRHSIS